MSDLPISTMLNDVNSYSANKRQLKNSLLVKVKEDSNLIRGRVTEQDWNEFLKKHDLSSVGVCHFLSLFTRVPIHPSVFAKDIERAGRLTKQQSIIISLLDAYLDDAC